MRGLLKRSIFAPCIVLLFLAGPASALFVVGDPLDEQSWGQRFSETAAVDTGGQSFDHLQFRMVTGVGIESDTFETPGLRNWSQGLWSLIYDTDTSLIAHRTALSTGVTFSIWFDDLKTDPLILDFQAYNAGVRVDNDTASWNGSGWSIAHHHSSGGWTQNYPLVPEPISMVMLGCVGAGMFAARKLRGKRAA